MLTLNFLSCPFRVYCMEIEDVLKIIEMQGGKLYGALRLQKMVFLLSHKYGYPLGVPFKKHYYGPFSQELQDLLAEMEKRGLVEIRKEGDLQIFILTEEGKKVASRCPFKFPEEIFRRSTEELKRESYDFLRRTSEIKVMG